MSNPTTREQIVEMVRSGDTDINVAMEWSHGQGYIEGYDVGWDDGFENAVETYVLD